MCQWDQNPFQLKEVDGTHLKTLAVHGVLWDAGLSL
jgi:hypothetical protein